MLGVNDNPSGNIDSEGESSRRLWQPGHEDEGLPGSSIVKSGVTSSSCINTNSNARPDTSRNVREHAHCYFPSTVHRAWNPLSTWSGMFAHVLPKTDNIVLAICLSKWDDIMGPQTIRVWLQEETEEHHTSQDSPGSRRPVNSSMGESSSGHAHNVSGKHFVPSGGDPYSSKNVGDQSAVDSVEESDIMNAVKYVTNHTVNCLTVSSSFGANSSSSHEKGTSFFAVPDFNLTFLSLLFQVKEEKSLVPYSFALIVSYENYKYFLQLRGLCLQWLRRIAFRFHISYVKNFASFDVNLWKSLNCWMSDFCCMLIELKQTGLTVMPSHIQENVIKSGILGRALTSHLQTFGSSVVIGSTANEINAMIAFLGLFLEGTEKHSSCLINPPRKYSFHMGLKLQGLLLDEFGGRDLASLELTSNPIPVTVIDLTLGNVPSAVKQTAKFHSYLVSHEEIYRQEYRYLHEGSGSSGDHESVMQNVRENGKLVNDLIKDLQLLPVEHWEKIIVIFLQRVNQLALTLLSLVSWMRRSSSPGGLINFPGDMKGGVKLAKYLKQTIKLEEADFLIVLSRAEKLKPGTYVHVMEATSQ